MNPGELRNRITILNPNGEIENELGETIPSLVEVAKVWAKVIPIRGKEYLEMQKLRPELNYRVTIRYRKNIHPAMIIRFEDKELEIESVIDIDSRKTYLELNCIEKRVKTTKNNIFTGMAIPMLQENQHIKVILGYPASGKTKYVENIMTDHDIVIDLDKLVSAMTMKPIHDRSDNSEYAVSIVNDLIDDFIDNIKNNIYKYQTAYIIRTKLSDKQYVKLQKLDAKFYWIDTDIKTCIERLIAQNREDVIPYLDSCRAFKERHKDNLVVLKIESEN